MLVSAASERHLDALLISGGIDSLIGEFTPEDVFVNLSKLDGGVIHGRPTAINSPSSLRTRSDVGYTFVKGRVKRRP
ncbi:MAG: hypothetical protein ACLPLP_19845 [Mycobacterium sp.]